MKKDGLRSVLRYLLCQLNLEFRNCYVCGYYSILCDLYEIG